MKVCPIPVPDQQRPVIPKRHRPHPTDNTPVTTPNDAPEVRYKGAVKLS